ncbi:hypothetical protein GORBP_028_00420 [Gordonia rubripertincta NBRC 101908]|uniref:ESX-1 secretion-associated protein n=1 Tax=Gordonia rubripertincta NBRC 101908 TaxID=1077975 RepID=A0ABQ0HP35_GORRU|nr:hypothetical protein GORBP_028_00420 [Gordonia rubripertincta NBRC 101908]
MTTPFSDDSLLPSAAPAMPASPHGDEYQLRSERALWERRAAVAVDVAAALDTAFSDLKPVGKSNHLGDCVEGRDVTAGLRRAVISLSADIAAYANQATDLARQCRTAATEFESTDLAGAEGIDA